MGKKGVGIKTYARVRCFFPGREKIIRGVLTKGARETEDGKGILTTLASETDHVRPMTTQFTDVLGEKTNNTDLYEAVCVPLIETTLEGYKALLIAYGQTGSGKTFTLIGAKGPGQLGLLPRTLQTMLSDEKVLKVRMKAFESYGMNRIQIYDLFAPENRFSFTPFVPPGDDKGKNKQAEYAWVQRKAAAARMLWDDKIGKSVVDTMKQGLIKEITEVDDGFRLVDEAHDASHFAKTGKNPESSRGHTVYILYVDIVNPEGDDYDPITTQFIVVDLAGSEGASTLDALPDGPEKACRFMEGGVINNGLSALKDMFGEMRKKGKLSPFQGTGLRKLLYPFVTSNTMMSICFTLSPSLENIMATRATMRFAQDACKLKMKPVAASGGKNFKKLYDNLKAKYDKKIMECNDLRDELKKATKGSKGSAAAKKKAKAAAKKEKEEAEELARMEEEAAAAPEGPSEMDLLAAANAEPIDVGEHVVLEELDSSNPPDVWGTFSEEQQQDLIGKMDNKKYVASGQMTEEFKTVITETYKVKVEVIDHLFGFLIFSHSLKKQTEHVSSFTAGLTNDGKPMSAEEMQDLPKILELQGKITALEADKMVEKSLKMWSTMRLKVRERKFRQLEEANAKEQQRQKEALETQVGKKNVELGNAFGSLVESRNQVSDLTKLNGAQESMMGELQKQIFILLHFPRTITVSGRSGFNDNMNGVYNIGGHLHDGRVWYAHSENTWVIRWFGAKKLWIMDHRGLKKDEVGSACVDDSADHPILIQKEWCVYDGSQFVFDPEINVTGEMQMPAKSGDGKRGPSTVVVE